MSKVTSADPNVVTQETVAANGQATDIVQFKKYDNTVVFRVDKDGRSFLQTQAHQADYILTKDGSTYKGWKSSTGELVTTQNTCADAMKALVTLLPATYGGTIYSDISKEYINFIKKQTSVGDAHGALGDIPYTIFNRTTPGRMHLMWFHSEHRATPPKVAEDKLTFTIDGTATTVDLCTLFGFAQASSPTGLRQIFSWRSKHMGGEWTGPAEAESGEPDDCAGGWIAFPINWKSTMKIEFTAKDSNSLIYWIIMWSDLPENDRVTKMSGRAYLTYPYLEIAPAETLTMVNTSGHPGRLLGVMLTQSASSFNFLPNDPTITIDGAALNSSGTEDFFMHSQYYWGAGQPDKSPSLVGPTGGILSRNYTYSTVSQYRDFLEEQDGIAFVDALIFTWPNLSGGLTTMCGYWVIWEEF